jgi:NlpC/P60 family
MRRRIAAMALLILALAAPQFTAAKPADAATLVVSIAESQIGKDFRMGTEGPDRFDCSGLVYYAFTEAGLYEGMFGTRRMLARNYLQWGMDHDALTTNPSVGDLILWTGRGTDKVVHIGIFVGRDRDGRPLALSALTTLGVRIHHLHNVGVDFLTYVDTGLTDTDVADIDPDNPSLTGKHPHKVTANLRMRGGLRLVEMFPDAGRDWRGRGPR